MIYRCPTSRRRKLQRRRKNLLVLLAIVLSAASLHHRQNIINAFPQPQPALTDDQALSSSLAPSDPVGEVIVITGPDLNEQERILAREIAKTYRIPQSDAAWLVNEVHQQAKLHNLDPILMLSIIATESSFNPEAKSHAGALGLMQVVPKWHSDQLARLNLSEPHQDLLNPSDNIAVGALVLKKYLRMQNGDVVRALQKYNGSLNDPSLTYSNKVLRHYDWLFRKVQS